jgi:hypothetical protein
MAADHKERSNRRSRSNICPEKNMSRNLPVAGVIAAVVAFVMVQPVVAYSINPGDASGTYGDFAETHEPDVVCIYDQATAKLHSMKVYPPALDGPFSDPTWVGWRYEIREGVESQIGDLLYSSPLWKSESSVAGGSGFAPSTWRTTTDISATHLYYVRYIFYWYAPGSKSTVEGKVIATPDGIGYRMKLDTSRTDSISGCTYDFPAVTPAPHLPDGWIRKESGTWAGNNIYNGDGSRQTRTTSTAAGSTARFDIALQNDGIEPWALRTVEYGSTSIGYSVQFFKGTTDITTGVTEGSFQTPVLQPGEKTVIHAVVTVSSAAAVGSSVSGLLVVVPIGPHTGVELDSVKFIVKRT